MSQMGAKTPRASKQSRPAEDEILGQSTANQARQAHQACAEKGQGAGFGYDVRWPIHHGFAAAIGKALNVDAKNDLTAIHCLNELVER